MTRGRGGRYNAVVAVEEKNRNIPAAIRKFAPAVLVALWAAPFIHHGSTKRAVPDMTGAVRVAGGEIDGGAGRPALPKGQTNGVPVGRAVPVAPAAATSASVASDAAASSEPTTTADGRFRVAVRPATNGLARPKGVALFDRWRRRGAADDAFRLAPPGWWFRLPDGFSDGVTIFSRGEIRPNVWTPYFPPVFADRVSLLPQARWRLLGAGAAESSLWHCLTPSNTLLVGWTNAALGRDPSAPTNAVAELFRDGRFTYRYADRVVVHSPVLPFDWDGDGLENSVDPDPRVAGPDAHGTDAAWYLSVCSNVFAAAEASRPLPYTSLQTRVGVGNEVVAALPPGVAWRAGVNTDAYYFVDVVAERGPAPVYFTADRKSRLGSPAVVALAEATNRVPLLVGVEYAVTSEVPFSLSVPAADARECVRVSWTSGLSCEIAWPLGFTFAEGVSGASRTYSVGVVPYDPGGTFDWGGAAAAQDGGGSVRSRTPAASSVASSAASCGCASGEGRTLSFSCSAGCPCGGGCVVAGTYALEGASFAVTGGTCRCGFDDPEPWRDDSCSCGDPWLCSCVGVCICHGADAGPGLSVSFGRDAVVFEEAYMDAPGVWRPRRSTWTTLSVSANGGPAGGRLALAVKGLERLAPVACGPIALPPSLELAAGETYSAEFLCEAGAASAAANDVEVVGEFIENGTGRTFASRAALTVVRLEIRQVLTPPGGGRPNRHTYGIGEKVLFIQSPSHPALTLHVSGDGVANGSNPAAYVCPLRAEENKVSVLVGSAVYAPLLSVIEPVGIECKDAACLEADLMSGPGMLLELHLLPYEVSFSGLAFEEVPSARGFHTGYFGDVAYSDRWSHTVQWGAGRWLDVKADNLMGMDESRMFNWPKPWSSGILEWDIPIGWNVAGTKSGKCAEERDLGANATWTMTADSLEKMKHGQILELTSDGRVYLNGELRNGD